MKLESTLDYGEWNRRLSSYFFGRSARHKPVRLRLDAATLAELGGNKEDLVQTVRSEVLLRQVADIQELGLRQLAAWRLEVTIARETRVDVPIPPFLPVLALYVLAVNHGDEQYASHDYYARLHSLLGGPQNRITSLAPSLGMWDALREWSVDLLNGTRGVFECTQVGRQEYVGVPRGQILLASREVPSLRAAFLECGLFPGSRASEVALFRAAQRASGLLSRTKRVLRNWPKGDDTARALLAEIRSEFDSWDSIDGVQVPNGGARELRLRWTLKLARAAVIDMFAETDVVEGITSVIRRVALDCAGDSNNDAEPRLLLVPVTAEVTRVSTANPEGPWRPSRSILEPLSFRIEDLDVCLSRRRRRYLIFGRGSRRDHLEEFEEHDLEPNGRYLLVTTDPPCHSEEPKFVKSFLGDWVPFTLRDTMCQRAFVAASTRHDSVRAALTLVGGIRSASGSLGYQPFALPTVLFATSQSWEEVQPCVQYWSAVHVALSGRVALRLITADGDDDDDSFATSSQRSIPRQLGEFELPPPPTNTIQGTIDVSGDSTVKPLHFFVDARPDVAQGLALPSRDAYGERTNTDEVARFKGLEVLRHSTTTFDEQLSGKPMSWDDSSARQIGPTNVMHLLRSRMTLSWNKARDWLPRCLTDRPPDFVNRWQLTYEVTLLHSLGILEVEEDMDSGWTRLHALPPALLPFRMKANLGLSSEGPRFGLVAALTGCWLEHELEALRAEGRRHGVHLHEWCGDAKLLLVPRSRLLVVEGDFGIERLGRAVSRLGVKVVVSTDLRGRAILESTRRLSCLEESERWTPGGLSHVWERQYFDPLTLSLASTPPPGEPRYILAECNRQDRHGKWFFVLDRHSDRRLQVNDRQLARWFVRVQSLPGAPLPVCGQDLVLPWELRLPRLLERGLALGTGRAPVLKRYSSGGSPFESDPTNRRFGIPPPPKQPTNWFRSPSTCSGNLVCYPDVHPSPLWPQGTALAMIGARAERIFATGLEA